MDRILRRELDAIARDHTSGASELALRSVKALESWLGRHPTPSEKDLIEIARCLLVSKGGVMAPVYRLLNTVLLAADAPRPAEYLLRSCARFRAALLTGRRRVADRFHAALRRRRVRTVITYSYSSTVLSALIRARTLYRYVVCAEGRPEMEGRHTATMLARAGIRVSIHSDVELPFFFNRYENPHELLAVVGADQVMGGEIVNKTGTELLLERAHRFGARAWVLADSTKFVPRKSPERAGAVSLEQRLWPEAPKGILVTSSILSPARIFPSTRILYERGFLTPVQVRREIAKIKLSPRLKELQCCGGAPNRRLTGSGGVA